MGGIFISGKGRGITQEAFKSICAYLDSASNEAECFYWASRKVHAHTVWNSMSQANFRIKTTRHQQRAKHGQSSNPMMTSGMKENF